MNDSISEILSDRGKTHGDFTHHAKCTQDFMRVAMAQVNWGRLSDIQKEMLHMNFHKCGRILTGNPDHRDHYDDIAGYAKLVSDRLGEEGSIRPPPPPPYLSDIIGPGTPEDGGHHARQEEEPEPAPIERFISSELMYDGAQGDMPPFTPSINTTDPVTGGQFWVIDRNHFSNGAVAHLAALPPELDNKEWRGLAPYYRGMYSYNSVYRKHKLMANYHQNWVRHD